MATGKKPASLAGKGLKNKSTSKKQKTIDASDLSQAPDKKSAKKKTTAKKKKSVKKTIQKKSVPKKK